MDSNPRPLDYKPNVLTDTSPSHLLYRSSYRVFLVLYLFDVFFGIQILWADCWRMALTSQWRHQNCGGKFVCLTSWCASCGRSMSTLPSTPACEELFSSEQVRRCQWWYLFEFHHFRSIYLNQYSTCSNQIEQVIWAKLTWHVIAAVLPLWQPV